MAHFVLNRDYRYISPLGHTVQFAKDEPVYVPPELHRLVQTFGALPTEDGVESVLGEEKAPAPEITPEQRREQIIAAFRVLEDRNEREDFTGQGIPSVAAMRELIPAFKVEKKEVEGVWREYVESKVVG